MDKHSEFHRKEERQKQRLEEIEGKARGASAAGMGWSEFYSKENIKRLEENCRRQIKEVFKFGQNWVKSGQLPYRSKLTTFDPTLEPLVNKDKREMTGNSTVQKNTTKKPLNDLTNLEARAMAAIQKGVRWEEFLQLENLNPHLLKGNERASVERLRRSF